MVYATDIITETFNNVKELFFPIRPKYWMRMGFVSMFSGSGGSGGSGSSGYNNNNAGNSSAFENLNIQETISLFNTKALETFSTYGLFIGIGILLIYLVSLFFTYLQSVFTFVFIDGLVKKDLKIKESFKRNNTLGTSLFFFRVIFGLVTFILIMLTFWPIISAFITNSLVDFNLILLLPIIILDVALLMIFGVIYFLITDFVIPIMYFENCGIKVAWEKFKIMGKNQKFEIFMYWLMKLVLGMAAGLVSLVMVLPALVLIVFVGIPLGGIGFGIYYLINMANNYAAIGITIVYAIAAIFLLVYLLSVLFVPISAFFAQYSLNMVRKMKEKAKYV